MNIGEGFSSTHQQAGKGFEDSVLMPQNMPWLPSGSRSSSPVIPITNHQEIVDLSAALERTMGISANAEQNHGASSLTGVDVQSINRDEVREEWEGVFRSREENFSLSEDRAETSRPASHSENADIEEWLAVHNIWLQADNWPENMWQALKLGTEDAHGADPGQIVEAFIQKNYDPFGNQSAEDIASDILSAKPEDILPSFTDTFSLEYFQNVAQKFIDDGDNSPADPALSRDQFVMYLSVLSRDS
jgi:hypothetical protein